MELIQYERNRKKDSFEKKYLFQERMKENNLQYLHCLQILTVVIFIARVHQDSLIAADQI